MTIADVIPRIVQQPAHALALVMMAGMLAIWTLHAMPARADDDACPVTMTVAELQQEIAAAQQHG